MIKLFFKHALFCLELHLFYVVHILCLILTCTFFVMCIYKCAENLWSLDSGCRLCIMELCVKDLKKVQSKKASFLFHKTSCLFYIAWIFSPLSFSWLFAWKCSQVSKIYQDLDSSLSDYACIVILSVSCDSAVFLSKAL